MVIVKTRVFRESDSDALFTQAILHRPCDVLLAALWALFIPSIGVGLATFRLTNIVWKFH